MAIDYKYFSEHSRQLKNTAKSEAHPHVFTFLGVDRLDPIKGLKEKVQGYESIERHPQSHGSVQLSSLLFQRSENCDIYKKYKDELFSMIESVNDRFSTPYWLPIDFFYYQMDEKILIQSYLSSNALIVTSLADGMNLVSYEYLSASEKKTRASYV